MVLGHFSESELVLLLPRIYTSVSAVPGKCLDLIMRARASFHSMIMWDRRVDDSGREAVSARVPCHPDLSIPPSTSRSPYEHLAALGILSQPRASVNR